MTTQGKPPQSCPKPLGFCFNALINLSLRQEISVFLKMVTAFRVPSLFHTLSLFNLNVRIKLTQLLRALHS